MNNTAIIQEITAGLSGDKAKDHQYLLEQAEKYKNPYSEEIIRAIGRLLFNCISDDLKSEAERVLTDWQRDIHKAIAEAKIKLHEGLYDDAEKLILTIPSSEGGFFKNDSESLYLCFNNALEETYYHWKSQPAQTVRDTGFPFKDYHMIYAYILFEKKEFDMALAILDDGLSHCPVETSLMFEKAEIYKIRKDIDTFFELTKKCHQFIYTPQDFARYFRNLGYYFIEKGQWSEAICSFLQSYYVFEDSKQKVEAELNYISDITGMDIDSDDYVDAEKIIGVHGIPFTPELDWLAIALKTGLSYMESNEFQLAYHYLYLFYQMTKDDEVLEKLNYCLEHLEGDADG